MAKINTEYRKLKNQARFVMEIIENKLVVSKKKKPVLVAELRKRDYEAFPKVSEAQKAGETDDVVDNEEEVAADEDSGARDFDYLLGVSVILRSIFNNLANSSQLPIWSLTQERVDKLKNQMVSKKEEHDAMEKLSEKDLWCQDLDAFVAEWELQLKEEADYQKSIRNTNRRASRKIGAGKNVTGRGRAKQDDEYNPTKPKAGPSKVIKVEQKPHQRFLSMFENKPKPKPKTSPMGSDGADDDEEASGMSDGDFDMLRAKPAAAIKEGSRAPSEQPANGRVKRAAAAAPKKWIVDDDESESDGNGEFDVGDLVKGIGGADLVDTNAQNGRLSLFAMSRPTSSHGRATTDLPKLKSKPSKIFNFSDDEDAADETNYEMLAKSSPHKTAAAKDTLDSYLSDSDDLVPITKKVPVKAAAPAAKSKPGRPKKAPAPKVVEAAQSKPVTLSPAAKAYAAKQNKMKLPAKKVISDDEDDVNMEEADLPAPKPAAKARGRPPRAAAVSKPKKPIYIDSDDDDMDADDNDESALVDEASEDDFDDSD